MSVALEVNHLNVSFKNKKQLIPLVKDVSFSVEFGKCLGILGESGSGKSMTCKAITGLLGRDFDTSGEALFEGRNLMNLKGEALRQIRGQEICMVLQNPMTCFDPLTRIGKQMMEGMKAHGTASKGDSYQKCIQALADMKIRNPEDVMMKYPHQLSGGMLQRVMIGLVLIEKPKLIIADEPTTAIDSITQYSVIEEFKKIKAQQDAAMIFISHDLGVISQIADEVIVMHDAEICQRGEVHDVMQNATNEYTKFLLEKKKEVMKRFYQIMQPERGNLE